MSDNILPPNREELPKVSVITVILNLIENNRVDVFKKCVKSVCNQTYPNIEHIIIDGASQDGTQQLLDEMGLTYISEKDTGIYNAMNKGAKQANGSYLIFMNSDDCFADSDTIETVVNTFLKTGADAVCGNSNTEYQTGFLKKRHNAIEHLLYRMSLCHQAFYCTKAVFDELGGFDESYRIAGDYDFIYKMLLHQKLFVKVKETLCIFRSGGASSQYEMVINDELNRLIKNRFFSVGLALTSKEIALLRTYRFLVPPRYICVRRFIHPKMRFIFDINYCQALLQALRRFLITIHFKKKQKIIRVLGITFLEQRSVD